MRFHQKYTDPLNTEVRIFFSIGISLTKIFILLTASDIEQLNQFPCGGYSDADTIVYLQHPCKILTSLEVGSHILSFDIIKKNIIERNEF